MSLDPDAIRECWDEKATEYTAACREVRGVSQRRHTMAATNSHCSAPGSVPVLGFATRASHLVTSESVGAQLRLEVPHHDIAVQGTRHQLLQVAVEGN